jgi:hypothetical protein
MQMKKVSLLLSMIALMGFSAMAQQPNLQQIKQRKSQSVSNTGIKLQMPAPQGLVETDTFGNLQPCDSVFYLWWYGSEADGYISGHNPYIDSAKAEKYMGVPGDQITGLWVFFAEATYTNAATQKARLKVWDDNGANGTPGTELGNVDRTHKSIQDDIYAGNLTTVYFNTPITMPADGNFFAGVQLEYPIKQGTRKYDQNRVVALANPDFFSSCSDDSLENFAWELWTDGIFILDGDTFDSEADWYPYWDVYGLANRNPVFPIVETSTGCSITSATATPATICKGKTTSLSVSGDATSWSWAPTTGVTCPTCATTSAKPNATTTYTVTGNGGECSATVTVTVNSTPGAGINVGTCSGGARLLTRTGTPTTGVTFKWFKDNVQISGATNSTYSATVSGMYKVRVTNSTTGCSKTSQNASVTIDCKDGAELGTFEPSVYPNPFTKSMSVTFATGTTESATVALLDFSGKMIREFRNVDVTSPLEINENIPAGVYFVRVIQGGNEKMIKVVKSE